MADVPPDVDQEAPLDTRTAAQADAAVDQSKGAKTELIATNSTGTTAPQADGTKNAMKVLGLFFGGTVLIIILGMVSNIVFIGYGAKKAVEVLKAR